MRRTAALAALALVGCGGGGPRARTHPAEIRAFVYRPDTLTAAPGDTVVWINRDVVPHTATAAGGWDTGEIRTGASGRLVAGARGTYAYACAYHPTMHGVLVVR